MKGRGRKGVGGKRRAKEKEEMMGHNQEETCEGCTYMLLPVTKSKRINGHCMCCAGAQSHGSLQVP